MPETVRRRVGSNVVDIGAHIDSRETHPAITEQLMGRCGIEGSITLPGPEPFRTLLGLVGPGDAVRVHVTATGNGAPPEVVVEIALGGDRSRIPASRRGLMSRALSRALRATYPMLVFSPGPDQEHGKGFAIRIVRPEARGPSGWQAQTLRYVPKQLAVAGGRDAPDGADSKQGDARPEIGLRLSLTGTALALALECIGREMTVTTEITAVELAAPVLRALGALGQEIKGEHERCRDPFLDLAAMSELARIRTLTREHTAWRLVCTIASPRPLDDNEVNLISSAVFNAPARVVDGDTDETDLSMLLPRGLGSQVLEHIVSAGVSAALDMTQQPQADGGSSTLLGISRRGKPIRISQQDRELHTYLIGATGTGKSTLLRHIMMQDIAQGHGLVLIDSHGDLFRSVLASVPAKRRSDVVIADAGDTGTGFTFNVLQGCSGDAAFDRNAVVNDLIELFRRELYRGVPEAFGPMFEIYFRNAALLLMASRGDEATILEFERVFQDDEFRAELIAKCPQQHVADFWLKTAERVTNHEISIESIAPYIVSKLNQITTNERLRPVLGATVSTLDFTEIIAKRRICLVNLDKMRLGNKSAAFLGGILLSRLNMAAMAQGRLPLDKRVPTSIVLDEFQTYATDSLSSMLAETRKFGFRVTLANQSITQIDGRGLSPDVQGPILGNVSNLIVFRVGMEDSNAMAGWFTPYAGKEELAQLPNYEAVARLVHNGKPMKPVQIQTIANDHGVGERVEGERLGPEKPRS